jgi:hypothetical protein
MFFIPADETSRPLKFIRAVFNWRAEIVSKNKLDVRGQVIKLAINSVYGKFAQRVGQLGQPPANGCLWYAAAITAGTRRKLMEAALNDPKAVIAFATDAVFSTRALPLDVPPTKILGEWEFEEGAAASVVQSGVYTIRQRKVDEKTGKNKVKIASRGFTVKDETASRKILPTLSSGKCLSTFPNTGETAMKVTNSRIRFTSGSAHVRFRLRHGAI